MNRVIHNELFQAGYDSVASYANRGKPMPESLLGTSNRFAVEVLDKIRALTTTSMPDPAYANALNVSRNNERYQFRTP
jgi:hypothetical protein